MSNGSVRPLSQKGCASCAYFGSESDGDYGEIFCGYRCDLRPHMANLRHFPFKSELACFVEEFWASDFAVEMHVPNDPDFCVTKSDSFKAWLEKWKPKMESLRRQFIEGRFANEQT